MSGATDSSYTIPSVVLGDAGSYDVVVSNAYGSATSNTATLTVNPITTSLSVTPASGTYGGTVDLSATLSPQVVGKTISFTLNGASAGNATTDASGAATLSGVSLSGIDAGSYPAGISASFSGDANYIASSDSDSLTITPAPLTVTADDALKVYGDSNPAFSVTYSGFVAGDDETDLLGTLEITTTATEASPVGIYPITPSGLSSTNYSITFVDRILAITPAPLTVTANDASRVYGSANPLFSGTITGIVNSDNITATYTCAATPGSSVGNYNIVPAPAGEKLGNYTVTIINGILTVTAAPLTITASDASRLYGNPNSAFNVTYLGFAAGDDETDLLGTLTITTTATANSPVGTYPITLVGLSSTNYSITFVNGTLTVTTAAPLTVTVSDEPDGKISNYTIAADDEILDVAAIVTPEDEAEPDITVAGITNSRVAGVSEFTRLSPIILISGIGVMAVGLIVLFIYLSRMMGLRKFRIVWFRMIR
ncbi:MAG TPA: MBG domain-containing protein [Candidatus Hydromicrobium sp.]